MRTSEFGGAIVADVIIVGLHDGAYLQLPALGFGCKLDIEDIAVVDLPED